MTVEWLFMHLSALCKSSFIKYLFKTFSHFKIRVCFFYVRVVGVLYILWVCCLYSEVSSFEAGRV